MSPETIASPAIMTAGGFAAVVFAWKFLLPLLKGFLEAQATSGRAQNATIEQLSAELTKALLRSEAADKRADGYFTEMTDMKGQIALLTYQLKVSNEQIERLTVQLHKSDEKIQALTQKLNLMVGGVND